MMFPTRNRTSYMLKNREPKINSIEKTGKLIKGIYLKILNSTKYEGGVSRSQLQDYFCLGDGQYERIMHRVADQYKDVFYDRRSIPRLYKTNPLFNKEIENTASKGLDLISQARKIKKQKELILAWMKNGQVRLACN